MAEIRLRNVSADFLKKLDFIQRDLKEKTGTGAIERLVEGYTTNQAFIKQLSARNTDLHKKLKMYYDAEATMCANVEEYIDELNRQVKAAKPLLNGLRKKAGTKRSQARKAPTR